MSASMSNEASRPPGQWVRADVERERTPEVSEAEKQALVGGNTEFALNAYQELRSHADNVVYSPLSVSIAMAMVYPGARGETRAEMTHALRYRLDEPSLHEAFDWLDLSLAGRAAPGANLEQPRLELVNSVFLQEGFPVQPAYLATLARYYGAGVSLMDFVQETEQSRQQINAWVADRTEDRIQDLLKPGLITPLTVLVLVNAMYFRASWASAFDQRQTNERGVFHASGGDVTVPMMQGTPKHLAYARYDGHQVMALPYAGEQMDMVILLPAAGGRDALETFEADLDARSLAAMLAALAPSHGKGVRMPRFSFRFSVEDMQKLLAALGMHEAFGVAADLSGIAPGLFISKVAHQAFIAVDEQGTEAAAATAVVVDRSIVRYIEVNRPFLFLIRDRVTGSILFLGRVVDPSPTPS